MNLAIVNLLIWPEMLDTKAKWVGGAALAILWLAALLETRGELRRQAERRRAENENRVDPETLRQAELAKQCDLQLAEAQQLYLAGEWIETERALLKLTKTNKDDIEAHLLLATVWRRMDRCRDAVRRLTWLGRLDAAAKWRFEIEQELERASKQPPELTSDETTAADDLDEDLASGDSDVQAA